MNISDYIYIYESNDTGGEWWRGGESEGRERDLKRYYFLRKS